MNIKNIKAGKLSFKAMGGSTTKLPELKADPKEIKEEMPDFRKFAGK